MNLVFYIKQYENECISGKLENMLYISNTIKFHRQIPYHDIDLIAKLKVSPKAKQFPFIKYSCERCYGCF